MGKKQHYIPQFYLRGFTSDGSSIGFFKLSDETYRENVPVNQNLYAFENVRLDDRLLTPGIPIREETLSWPIPLNAAGLRRSYSIMLDSMQESNREEDLSNSFVAKFKRSQTIL